MRDSGKANKYCHFKRPRIFTGNQLPGISYSLVVLPSPEFQGTLEQQSSGVDYGKRCETRENPIDVVISRGLASLLVINSQEYHDFQ